MFVKRIKQKEDRILKKREVNIECLRAIACIAVVILHVNAWCFEVEKMAGMMLVVNAIINTLVRFAVPCFMLITGKFVFQNISKHGARGFYKRTIDKVIIPTFGFSIMYVLYTVLKGLLDDELVLKEALHNLIKGIPFGHMWYMYMLIGFYLIAPLVGMIREKLSNSAWGRVGIFCVLLGSVFYNGNLLAPCWLFCWIQYIGYFILGDFFWGGDKKNQLPSIILWIVNLTSLFIMCLYSLKVVSTGMRYDFQPQNFLTVIYSMSMFSIFNRMRIDKLPRVIEQVAKQSANIYYIHALVINIIIIIMNRLEVQYKFPVIFLLFTEVMVLIISYVGGVCVDDIVLLLRNFSASLGTHR